MMTVKDLKEALVEYSDDASVLRIYGSTTFTLANPKTETQKKYLTRKLIGILADEHCNCLLMFEDV